MKKKAKLPIGLACLTGAGLDSRGRARSDATRFEALKLKALWCGYFANNAQSQIAQTKCGFRHHHTEENKYNQFLQDYRTEHISRITAQEWLALPTQQA